MDGKTPLNRGLLDAHPEVHPMHLINAKHHGAYIRFLLHLVVPWFLTAEISHPYRRTSLKQHLSISGEDIFERLLVCFPLDQTGRSPDLHTHLRTDPNWQEPPVAEPGAKRRGREMSPRMKQRCVCSTGGEAGTVAPPSF